MGKEKPEMYRQGDVLLIPAYQIANYAFRETKLVNREDGKLILAYGEQTGHSHAILEEDVDLSETTRSIEKFLRVHRREGATLVHEEHAPIHIPQGHYLVRMQRQLHPTEETEELRASYD